MMQLKISDINKIAFEVYDDYFRREAMSHSKPYPKHINPNSMREARDKVDTNWHSHPPNTDKMRKIANRAQEDDSNLPNGQLNSMDSDVGPVKGGH